jgi:ubiquitin C-terminal hydrolase
MNLNHYQYSYYNPSNNRHDKNDNYLFMDENRKRRIEYSNNLIRNNYRANSNKIQRSGRPNQNQTVYNNNKYNINYNQYSNLIDRQSNLREKNYRTTSLYDNHPPYNELQKENNINERLYYNNDFYNLTQKADDNYYTSYKATKYEREREKERDYNTSNRVMYNYKIINNKSYFNNDYKSLNGKTQIIKKENNSLLNNNKLNDDYNKLTNNNKLNNNNSKFTNDNIPNEKYIFNNRDDNNPTYLKPNIYEGQKDKQNLFDYGMGFNERQISLNAKTQIIPRKNDLNSNNNNILDNKEDKKQTVNYKYNENYKNVNNNKNDNSNNNKSTGKTNNTTNKLNNNNITNYKEPEIEVASSQDYLPEAMNTQNTIHHRSNKENKSKSVNPYTKVTQNEVSQIVNSSVGLNNLGATCYMNSALQNIIHCKKLIDKLISYKNSSKLKNISRNNPNITNSFLDLCDSLLNSKNKYSNERSYLSNYIKSSVNPTNFKLDFCTKHAIYTRGQHDSIEFLRTLLDDISKETNENQNISAYKELSTTGKSKEVQNSEYHDFFISRENSIIIDLFYLQMINIFTCECGFESYSFQKLLDIPLLLPMKKREIDLISLIKEYLKEEKIDWSSKCEKCQKANLVHLKKIKLSMLNDIVIFSLQRFDPFLSMKSSIYVSYDEIIDLKEFCDFDLYKNNTIYKLCGTINHIGNINYGHYYSYVKIGDIWYEFNDSIVRAINRMDLNSSSVCVLFYEKA